MSYTALIWVFVKTPEEVALSGIRCWLRGVYRCLSGKPTNVSVLYRDALLKLWPAPFAIRLMYRHSNNIQAKTGITLDNLIIQNANVVYLINASFNDFSSVFPASLATSLSPLKTIKVD